MLFIQILFFVFPLFISAQSHIWTGNGGDSSWFNPSNWNLNSVPDASSNTLISAASSNVEISLGTAVSNFVTVHNGATLTVDGNLAVTGSIIIDNNASMIWRSGTISGGCTIENTSLLLIEGASTKTLDAVTVNNNGEFNINNSNQIILANGVVINNAFQKVINITSVGGFISQGANATLNNDGVIRKSPDGINPFGNFYLILEINNSGTMIIPEDETFLILVGAFTFTNNGNIVGNGTLDITANFINTGIVIPEDGNGAIGTLNITNNFNLSPGGSLHINIGIDGLENDVIAVTGSPVLNGNITVELESDLNIGDQFQILTATNGIPTCNFPQYVYADTFAGTIYEFEVICLATSVVLNVTDILGVDDFNTDEINFYISPNPIQDVGQFVFPSELILEYRTLEVAIYNYSGQQIIQIPLTSEENILETFGFASGLYLVQLRANNEVLATTKLVIE